ncbi:MAG: hypothetical protein JO246_15985, partial [Frankiaceae bacterium]|nr:hypothetical protein [Frankiaceae bacterium]
MKAPVRKLFGLSVISAVIAAGVVTSAPAAHASVTGGPTPNQLANTAVAGAVSVNTSDLPVLLTVPAAQLQGPGSHTESDNTYASATPTVTGTGCVALVCTGSKVDMTFNLKPGALPAAPGVYNLDVCAVSCAAPPLDTSTLTVTGDAPTPAGNVTQMAITQGTSGAVDIPGTGFAKLESLSVAGVAANKLTFTEDNATSSATDLKGTLAVDLTVPAGLYDVTVTDTAGQTGVCSQCLHVVGVGTPPGAPAPVTNLDAQATGSTTATATWTASEGATAYSVYASKTGALSNDPGVTTTVANNGAGTSADIKGL